MSPKLDHHSLLPIEPNVDRLEYAEKFSVLATNPTHRKMLGSGISRHGLVIAIAGIRNTREIGSSRSMRYDTHDKTGSCTSVVFTNVLTKTDEFVTWLRSWLYAKTDSQQRSLDLWDIGASIITHLSRGHNRTGVAMTTTTTAAAAAAATTSSSTSDPAKPDLLVLLVSVLKESQYNQSSRALALSMYLKRHVFGFEDCFSKYFSKTKNQVNEMLIELHNEEIKARLKWVEHAIILFVNYYCSGGGGGESVPPSKEERVACFLFFVFCFLFLFLFLFLFSAHHCFFFFLFVLSILLSTIGQKCSFLRFLARSWSIGMSIII